jgi:hypothetical protein
MKVDAFSRRKSQSRRQIEASLDRLSNFGFIFHWERPVGEDKYTVICGGSDGTYDYTFTLKELRVFLATMDFVNNYPTTIQQAIKAETDWRIDLEKKLGMRNG